MVKCDGCKEHSVWGDPLMEKTGYCSACRDRAFGFDSPHSCAFHTGMKDRKTNNMVGASAAEFNTGTLRGT